MKEFKVDNQTFTVSADPRTDTPFIRSIHPYDETEYHWARKNTDGTWSVYRNRKFVRQIPCMPVDEELEEQTVADLLLRLDKTAILRPRIAIW